MRIGQTKNNVAHLCSSKHSPKKKKKKNVANETVKIEQTKTTVAILL